MILFFFFYARSGAGYAAEQNQHSWFRWGGDAFAAAKSLARIAGSAGA